MKSIGSWAACFNSWYFVLFRRGSWLYRWRVRMQHIFGGAGYDVTWQAGGHALLLIHLALLTMANNLASRANSNAPKIIRLELFSQPFVSSHDGEKIINTPLSFRRQIFGSSIAGTTHLYDSCRSLFGPFACRDSSSFWGGEVHSDNFSSGPLKLLPFTHQQDCYIH